MDAELMRGVAIRDRNGLTGRVLGMDEGALVVAWDRPGDLLPNKESICLGDPRLESQLEVLTLDRGWLPAHNVPSLREMRTCVRIDGLAEDIEDLLTEAGRKHHPFKRKSTLGAGPRGRTVTKTRDWDCTCANYQCQCKGIKHKWLRKTVKINPSYKAAYNKEYRAWRTSQEKD